MKITHSPWLAVVALAIVLPTQAFAQSSPVLQATESSVAQTAGFDKPVSTATLERLRGGSEFVHNEMDLTGTTSNNTAINVPTGSNTISSGAFSNMSGMPLVIQNTGANVLIQNAMIVNLKMN
ncbi:MAG: hypothetical protein ABIV07_13180 [Polaromonas sp.]